MLLKKTEAFFAGVIKESEMMLESSAEESMENTTTAIDLECLPTDANEDRGVQNLEFVPVSILAQSISCSNVRGVFPLMSFSGFVLSKCLCREIQTQTTLSCTS